MKGVLLDPITKGMQGPAVEDIQTRLIGLGYTIDEQEYTQKLYGDTTARAVASFRVTSGLDALGDVDIICWSALVDASYKLGDRTLYLRLPNFHGADVVALQQALNALGFGCGDVDGYFGPHTENALQQFQENVGLFADGMAFQDTFRYIDRLRHVWEGKPSVLEAEERTGFARAANVLEHYRIAVSGQDAIARNIASRMWNIASATTENSGMVLSEGEAPEGMDLVLELASARPLRSPSATTLPSALAPLLRQLHPNPRTCVSNSPALRATTARSRQAMRKPLLCVFSMAFALP